jgi:hypothetical protein
LVEHRLKREIDEITDVTVHIDPEDDECTPACDELPLRPEVLARLASLWSSIPLATERREVVLHYLGGAIDVDVIFPLTTCLRPNAAPEALEKALNQAIQGERAFRRVRVLYGG